MGPGDVSGGLVAAEAGIRFRRRVEEHRHFPHLVQHPGHHLWQAVPAVLSLYRHVDVKAAPRCVRQRLGGEVGAQAVALCDELHNGLEGHHVIRRSEGVGVFKVDLILARPLLVVGALGGNPHAGQGQADLPADVLPLVVGGDVHVPGSVIGDFGGLAVFVPFKQVKLLFRAKEKAEAPLFRPRYGVAEQGPGVAGEGPAVGVVDGAEHAHHLPVLRPPGQQHQGVRVGPEQQVRPGLVPEAGDGRGVEGDAVLEGTGQL